MPANHHIDRENRLIFTTWQGEASDSDIIEVLMKYQAEIRNTPVHRTYHEIVSFSRITGIKVTARGLINIAKIASQEDQTDARTKLALVVNSGLAFSFASTYAKYRKIIQNVSKDIRVFRTEYDALEWCRKNV